MTRAFIICIGDELTKGEILNSNAAFIAWEFTRRGISVQAIVDLPDELDAAVRHTEKLLQERGIFVFSGGLGGTQDDITRKIVGSATGRRFLVDREKGGILREWYHSRNRGFHETDLMQASYPEGGALLENTIGIAHGFFFKEGERIIFSLPGVPKEMQRMFELGVLPILEKNGYCSSRRSETLLFSGIPEYTLDRVVGRIVSRYGGLRHGTRAGYDIVRVVLESGGKPLEGCIEEIERTLSEQLVSRGERPIEQVAGELLLENKLKLSVAESCSAGLLSKVITDVPGSSRYFVGGVVAYSNEAKKKNLSVREETLNAHGAVSARTAMEMARGAEECFSSDLAIAITGVAGPEGGTAEKPVGTVFICVDRIGYPPMVEKCSFLGDRESVRLRSVNRALFMLIRFLRKGQA